MWASQPVVADGTVYVGSRQSGVYAIDAETGRTRRNWPFTDPNGETYSPVVADKTVYVGGDEGRIYAIDAQSGVLRDEWSFDVDLSGWTADLVVVDDIVYFVGQQQNGEYHYNIYAINATTGEVLDGWPFTEPTDLVSVPAVAHDSIYVGTNDGTVYAIDAKSGAVRDNGNWPFEARADFHTRPVIAGDTVYIRGLGTTSDAPDKLYAINAQTGVERDGWPYEGPAVRAPAVAGDTVYTSGETIAAIDISEQQVRDEWSFDIKLPAAQSREVGASVVAGDTVYFTYGRGYLYAIDATTGALREGWPFRILKHWTFMPTVVDEAIYTSAVEGPPLAVKSSQE